MAIKELGHAGVSSGWRKAVADRVSPRVAERTPLRQADARALVGIAFLAIAALYLGRALREAFAR